MRISPKHGFAVKRSCRDIQLLSFAVEIYRPSDVAKSTGRVFPSAGAKESEEQ